MKRPDPNTTRRQFLKYSVLAAAGTILARTGIAASSDIRPRGNAGRLLNVALVGTSGRAQNTIRDFVKLDVNVVALCDVDPARLARGVELASPKYPEARTYSDYRKLFETEKELNAVVVTTPDHMHAPISLLAMSHGLHVFCEKPLARTIGEVRWMRDFARRSGVVTQMGTQSSASEQLRRAIEIMQSDVIGQVREVHIWTDRSSRMSKGPENTVAPEGMKWDTWVGVRPERPFTSNLHPGRWRWWQDFGCGPLGDMGCHLTNLSFRALDLAAPAAVDVSMDAPAVPGLFPANARFDYRFPARGRRVSMTFSWYEGGRMPDAALLESLGIERQFGSIVPNNKLIIGDKGVLLGENFIKLEGEEQFQAIAKHEACLAVPESIARNPMQGTLGHYHEWVEACQGRGMTFTNFDIAAAQTEMVLLGTVAAKLGRSIKWDAATMSIPGEPASIPLLRPDYRSGFTVAAADLPPLPAPLRT